MSLNIFISIFLLLITLSCTTSLNSINQSPQSLPPKDIITRMSCAMSPSSIAVNSQQRVGLNNKTEVQFKFITTFGGIIALVEDSLFQFSHSFTMGFKKSFLFKKKWRAFLFEPEIELYIPIHDPKVINYAPGISIRFLSDFKEKNRYIGFNLETQLYFMETKNWRYYSSTLSIHFGNIYIKNNEPLNTEWILSIGYL